MEVADEIRDRTPCGVCDGSGEGDYWTGSRMICRPCWGRGKVPFGYSDAYVALQRLLTADARFDDPTIRRRLGFARGWGYNRLLVGNLFALRATNPDELLAADDPVGPENDDWLAVLAGRASMIVLAWGAHKAAYLGERAVAVRGLLRGVAPTYSLGTTRGGQPKHPLYLPGSLLPQPLR